MGLQIKVGEGSFENLTGVEVSLLQLLLAAKWSLATVLVECFLHVLQKFCTLALYQPRGNSIFVHCKMRGVLKRLLWTESTCRLICVTCRRVPWFIILQVHYRIAFVLRSLDWVLSCLFCAEKHELVRAEWFASLHSCYE